MNNYVKVKLRLPDNKRRITWAVLQSQNEQHITLHKCNRAGETVPGSTLEIIIASPNDVIWVKPAELNLKYNQLETESDIWDYKDWLDAGSPGMTETEARQAYLDWAQRPPNDQFDKEMK